MADDQAHYPGGHYSGRNPIPTVNKFLQNLDKDKKARDDAIDRDLAERKNANVKNRQPAPATRETKEVTDPTTKKQVEIADADKDFARKAKDPQLSIPNANLDKPTPVRTVCFRPSSFQAIS